eukprot:TRINITY_DN30635_c0_g1_i1.p1 TRINITY_DN30635_c0_g1~~TRINITY_DN30635_c0_g1_i1.p1  ORF type:complete len:455 (+),score=95.35 TRINITY_DN30635_c0_g1_i1:58-1422(+)
MPVRRSSKAQGSPSPRRRRQEKREHASVPAHGTDDVHAAATGPCPKPLPPACGGDAPATPYAQGYFSELTREEMVEVVEFPGKGKGLRVTANVSEEDAVLEENALVVCQNMQDRRDCIPVCAVSFQSLETPEDVFKRVMADFGDPAVPDLPHHSAFKVPKAVPCVRDERGCKLMFASKQLRDRSETGWHAVLCQGRMDQSQSQAYDDFLVHDWSQGGTDFCDCFLVALHGMGLVLAKMRVEGMSPEQAWEPFSHFAWLPWTQLATHWAKSEKCEPSPEKVLADLVRAFREIFKPSGAEVEAVVNEERVDRLLGLTLLNAQERSPESPWGRYITWLEEKKKSKCPLIKGQYDWRAKRPTDASNKLYYSASGQGLYRVHAASNHSCDPSAEVRYTDASDESLMLCALRPLRKGEEVTISYIADVPTVPLAKRQRYLSTNYRFDCTCSRCEKEKAES